MSGNPIGVKVTYSLPGRPTEVRVFDQESVPGVDRVGLAEGATPVKPEAGSHAYSGMHDQGPLPELREGGPVARLMSCARAAEDDNDAYLTELIRQEKEHQPSKKAKVST